MQPKFKPILKPLIHHGDTIRIGLEHDIYDLEDPDGKIQQLLTAMDGRSTIDEIAERCALSVEEVQDALATFDELGFLEDAAATVKGLSERDRQRYRANLSYFSNFSSLSQNSLVYQKRLKDANVAILGLGGASLMAASLAGLGIGKIIGLDFDRVELSNLNRQFLYREDDIGKLKTEASVEQLRSLNQDIEVEAHNLKVTDAASLLDVLQDADLVINGLDTPVLTAFRWVNSACVHLGKPMLLGGVSNNRLIVQRFLPAHGCYDCSLIHFMRLDVAFELEVRALYGNIFEQRNTAIAPHVSLLSGLVTAEVAKHLAGHLEPMPPSSTLEMDTVTMQIKTFDPWPRYEDCPTCGSHRTGRDSIEPVDLEELISIAKSGMVAR